MNAFTSVRPRGVDAPAKAPRKTSTSKAPMEGNVHLALDRNGRRTVGMAPRTTGAIAIEGREQGDASTQKRAALQRGMSQ